MLSISEHHLDFGPFGIAQQGESKQATGKQTDRWIQTQVHALTNTSPKEGTARFWPVTS